MQALFKFSHLMSLGSLKRSGALVSLKRPVQRCQVLWCHCRGLCSGFVGEASANVIEKASAAVSDALVSLKQPVQGCQVLWCH